MLERIALEATVRSPDRNSRSTTTAPVEAFQAEPSPHHTAARENLAPVLQASPRWARRSYWLLIAGVLASVLYGAFGTISEYAEGPAVIQIPGRTDIVAAYPGTVATIEVAPGELVQTGQVLVRFRDMAEPGELLPLTREYDLNLIALLRNPADVAARQALSAVRVQKALAEGRLESRILRAPLEGEVCDIRGRAGQYVSAGDIIMSLAQQGPPPRVVVLLPGRYGPQLTPGMRLSLKLDGYESVTLESTVKTVAFEIIGPREVARYLGRGAGDTVSTLGPVALVTGVLPTHGFVEGSRSYRYHEGMMGRATVRTGSKRALFKLLPALEEWSETR